MADEPLTLEAIRARCSESITEIVSNAREYYRVQTILRDRAFLLAEVEHWQQQYRLMADARGWRCFWCNAVFVTRAEAEAHFGKPYSGKAAPECTGKSGGEGL